MTKYFTNYGQMAKDCWLFLTDDSMPNKAVIKKVAFLHEVKIMIETAALFKGKETNDLKAENAALRQQVKDMGEVIKELRGKSILDSIDVRFDGITVQGDDRILSLTLSRKS